MEQETLTIERRGDSATREFDPREHGFWRRFKVSTETSSIIDHGAWLAAARETPPAWVGTCPACGGYLRPRPPTTVSSTRIDYEADCVQPDCGKSILAPGGRLQGRRYTRPRGM